MNSVLSGPISRSVISSTPIHLGPIASERKKDVRGDGYGTMRQRLLPGTGPAMPQRALLYRRPTEPQAIEVACENAIYLVRLRRHRQARRYTLRIQAATREVILTMPPRGSLKEAKEFAQKHGGWIAARMHRLPQAVPFADGTIVPLRGVEHRITHRPGLRGTVWTETDEAGNRLLCVAGEPPH